MPESESLSPLGPPPEDTRALAEDDKETYGNYPVINLFILSLLIMVSLIVIIHAEVK